MLDMLLATASASAEESSTISAGVIIAIIVALVVLILIISFIKIVPQSTAVVVERLGRFSRVLHTGLHLVFPFIDRVVDAPITPYVKVGQKHIIAEKFGSGMSFIFPARPISLKERLLDFPAQEVITKDNVAMLIDTVVYCQVTDPKQYTYGVENPLYAIKNLTLTTLRNIVGDLELDQTLTSRDLINSKMRKALDEATGAWGVKINRVEIQKIEPADKQIKEAMRKQAIAERERRAAIIAADATKRAAILEEEGRSRARILEADSTKQANILRAEGQRQADILNAEGQAKSIELINYSFPEKEYMTLQAFEALKALADGQATKIIVPSEIQNIAGLLAGLKGVVETDKPVDVNSVADTTASGVNNAK